MSAEMGSQCSQDCLFQPTLTYSGKEKTYPRRAVVSGQAQSKIILIGKKSALLFQLSFLSRSSAPPATVLVSAPMATAPTATTTAVASDQADAPSQQMVGLFELGAH